jgi:hypothetical protein
MDFLQYVIARMREASSYAGLVGALLGALHVSASPDVVDAALGVVAALGGLLAVLIPEKTAGAAVRAFLPVVIAGSLAVALSACSGAGQLNRAQGAAASSASGAVGRSAAGTTAPLDGLASFVTTDLQNALLMAQANNDAAAAQCYKYLIPQVAAAQRQLGSIAPAAVTGGFSAFEAGRVAVTNIKGFVNGVPQGLNLACAPLVLDAGNTLVGLAAKVGLMIALPAGALLPTLP